MSGTVALYAEHVDGVLRLTKVGDTPVDEMSRDDLKALFELIAEHELSVEMTVT